jgi:hypothetical protein
VRIQKIVFVLALVLAGTPVFCAARDVGIVPLPFGEDKFSSSLLYSRIKQEDDFDTRGLVESKGNLFVSELAYAVFERSIVSVRGGVLTDVEQSAQNAKWLSRSGYLFGAAFRYQIFPVTDVRPGIQVSANVSRFYIPLDRVDVSGTVSAIDHKISGWSYSGRVVAQARWWQLEPYAGLQGSGRSVQWRDHRPTAGSPAEVSGSAEGNISIVAGLPVRIRKDIRLQLEGLFLNQTSLTAGFTISL